MTQTRSVNSPSVARQFAPLALLGFACLAASACGVQDELSGEEAGSLTGTQAALRTVQNVSAGKPVTAQGAVSNNPQLITDSSFAPEGTFWADPSYAVITPLGSSLQVDLGRTYTLDHLVVQADNNDRYAVDGSADGVSWERVTNIPVFSGPGLRTRPAVDFTYSQRFSVRFLRISAIDGDSSYSVSEFQAFAYVSSDTPDCCCSGTCRSFVICLDVQCPQ